MPGEALEKNTLSLIYYFISRLNGVLGKTHLQKLLFLSDLISVKTLKSQITPLEYKRYKHGPFATKVDEYSSFLIEKGYIEQREYPFSSDEYKTYTRYYDKKLQPIKEVLQKNIGPEKMLIVDEVIDSYGNMSLQNLLDIVYDLQIVKESKMDNPLPLDVAKDNQQEEEVDVFGLDLGE